MAADFEVFISHRTEDQEIAKELGYTLRTMSRNALQINISEEIQGGVEWRDWIAKCVNSSTFLIFLYTDADADWKWCLYELGLFRGKIPARPLVCIKDPDIHQLPSPIEDLQCYDADKDGLERFLSDALCKGAFTGAPLNPEIQTDKRMKEDFERYLSGIVKRFVPMTHVELFADRIMVTVSRATAEEIEILEEPIISGTESAMNLVGLSSTEGAPWDKLYAMFQSRGQTSWLDELKTSIECLRNGERTIDVMTPFTTVDGRRLIPVLARYDTFRVRREQRDEPRCLFVIFVDPPRENGSTASLRDMRDVMTHWTTKDSPTSIVQVKWKSKSSALRYTLDDVAEPPIIYASNDSFNQLFDFQQLPDPLREPPLTAGKLIDLVKSYMAPAHRKALEDDQAEVAQRIIFENRPSRAKAPLTFNDRHPNFPKESFLPSLVAKQVVGETTGPHEMYLLIHYVKHFWPLDNSNSPFFSRQST